jgi:hypothetical protein
MLLADQIARIAKIVTGVGALAVDPTGTTSAVITGANVTADSYLGLRDILAASPTTQAVAHALERKIADHLAAPNFHMPKDGPILLPQMVERTVPTPTDLLHVDLAIADPQTKASRLLEVLLARMPVEYSRRADLVEAFCNLLRPAYAALFSNDDFLKTQAPAIARETYTKLAEIAESLLSLSSSYGSLAKSLDDLRRLHHRDLEALAFRFGLTPARGMETSSLLEMIEQKAEAFRDYQGRIEGIDERTAGLGNLKAAAKDAAARLDFDAVDSLLGRVDEVETEIAAETKVLRARNDLMRGRADAAFAHLSAAADSFAGLDALEPARRRAGYEDLLYSHGLRFGGAGLALAAQMNSDGLDRVTHDQDAGLWAQLQNNLAIALQYQGSRTAGAAGTDLLTQAIAAYDAALTVCTQDAHPVDWAITKQNKAVALETQGTRTAGAAGTDLLTQAIAAYDAAMTVRTKDAHPVDWAMTMQNKAGALQTQGSRTAGAAGTDLLTQAVAAYDAAMTVYTQDAHPVDWAITKQNKAVALKVQGTRTLDESGLHLLEQARQAYLDALTVQTRADHPAQWAMTQENLAILEYDTARHTACVDPVPHLRAALAHVDLALEIYDPVHMSHNHASATALRAEIISALDG